MDSLSIVYCAYAAISIVLTVWLATMLSRSGRVFLEDVFVERPELASAINRLLVVGFYLLNLGYASLLLSGGHATDLRSAIEVLATKLGALLMSLAVVHFLNMFVFHRIRRQMRRNAAPPVRPTGNVSGMASSTVFSNPSPAV